LVGEHDYDRIKAVPEVISGKPKIA